MSESTEPSTRIEGVTVGVFITFLLFAVILIYWAAVRAPQLAERGDNPRAVEAELRIRRGRILDANGIVLAETLGDDAQAVRQYPVTPGGPAVGYYSFRHGTAGVEAAYDDVLRGTNDDTWKAFWRRTLHRSQVGHDVRLTLDADWQRAAEDLMRDETGALLVLSLPEGAIRIMSSAPSYDANRIDEMFDTLVSDDRSPLLNRAAQGLYQPGLAIQPLILAYALEHGLLELPAVAPNVSEPVAINGQVLTCRQSLEQGAPWASALREACPSPMLALAGELGRDGLLEALDAVALFDQADLSLATAPEPPRTIEALDQAILGQDLLIVSPLQMARAFAALANDGILPTPHIVREVQDNAGVWQVVEPSNSSTRIVSASTAQAIINALDTGDDVIAEHAALAISGPGEKATTWYLGISALGAPQYVVVVVLEGTADVTAARDIGRAVLHAEPAP